MIKKKKGYAIIWVVTGRTDKEVKEYAEDKLHLSGWLEDDETKKLGYIIIEKKRGIIFPSKRNTLAKRFMRCIARLTLWGTSNTNHSTKKNNSILTSNKG